MSLRVDRAELEIVIKNDSSRTKLRELEGKMKDIKKEMRGLDKNSPEWEALNKQLRAVTQEYDDMFNSIGLVNLSTRELRNRQRELSMILQNLPPTHPLYNQYNTQLTQVNARLLELRGTAQRTGLSLSNLANGFNKYLGIGAAAVATITGMSYTFRKLAEDVAHLDDVYSDVQKTTGMTRVEVVDLNESFKKMDTRTAREELNNLARDAGKLGIAGKKEVLGFVEAGNQINVALGEDLGEGAIKNVGKIVNVFAKSTKELDAMDLKGKMLAVGSAINELGANSTASEEYMVSFTGRMGGIATQAGITVDQILGYASGLDQNMQALEMSATALQQLIMKIMGEPSKFAKIAGMEVSKFTTLVKTDMNGALVAVLKNLQGKGGLEQLIPIFKEMGLDGARASQVISALAGNIDQVVEAQDLAHKSLIEGTSLTNEYNTKNNNLQATLEKQRKMFQDAALDLGERLNPALLKSTNLISYLIKLLPGIIDWFSKYGKTILSLAVSIGTYIVVVKLITLLTGKWTIVEAFHNRVLQAKNLIMIVLRGTLYTLQVAYYTLTGQVVKARASMIAFAAVTGMTNPLVILTAVIAALAAGIYILSSSSKEAYTTAKLLNDINKEATRSIISEKNELAQLLTIAKNERISKEERLKAIQRLNEISPEYLGKLNLENINTKEATKYVDAYTQSLIKNAKAKQILAKIDELTKLKDDQSDSKDFYKKEPMNLRTIALKIFGIDTDVVDDARNKLVEKSNDQIDSMLTTLEDTYQKMHGASETGLINELQLNRSFLKEYEQEHANTYARIQDNKKKTFYSQAEEAKDNIELNLIAKKLDAQRELVKEKEAEYAQKVTPNKTDNAITPTGKGDKSSVQKNKIDKVIKDLEEKHLSEMASIKKRYAENDIKTEYEYNQLIIAQQNKFDDNRKDAIKKLLADKSITDATIRLDLSKQLADIEQKNYDRIIAQNEKIKKILLDADPIEAEKQAYANRLRELGLFGIDREKMTSEQIAVLKSIEDQHKENMRKLDSKNATLKLKQLATEQATEENELTDQRSQRLITEQKYKDDLLAIELKFLNEKLRVNGLSADKIEEINKLIVDKQRAATEDKTQTKESVLDKFNLTNPKDKYQTELDILKYYEDQGVLTHQQAIDAKKQIDLQYYDNLTKTTRETLSATSQIAGTLASALSEKQQSEESAIERRYKKEIAAAGNNSKKVAKLEEEKEAAIHAVRAKYADKQFILTVAQVISSTAVAAMEAYRAMAGIPVVGPALGMIASGAALAAGAAQISSAKEQQEAAKKGYQSGGYTSTGISDSEEAGVVHNNEFVNNADGVRNPHVKKFLDVFDVAQKQGTIKMLNTTDIWNRVKRKGFQTGGYTSPSGQTPPSDPILGSALDIINQNTLVMQKLYSEIEGGIYAPVVISGKNGLSKKLKEYNSMINNVSR